MLRTVQYTTNPNPSDNRTRFNFFFSSPSFSTDQQIDHFFFFFFFSFTRLRLDSVFFQYSVFFLPFLSIGRIIRGFFFFYKVQISGFLLISPLFIFFFFSFCGGDCSTRFFLFKQQLNFFLIKIDLMILEDQVTMAFTIKPQRPFSGSYEDGLRGESKVYGSERGMARLLGVGGVIGDDRQHPSFIQQPCFSVRRLSKQPSRRSHFRLSPLEYCYFVPVKLLSKSIFGNFGLSKVSIDRAITVDSITSSSSVASQPRQLVTACILEDSITKVCRVSSRESGQEVDRDVTFVDADDCLSTASTLDRRSCLDTTQPSSLSPPVGQQPSDRYTSPRAHTCSRPHRRATSLYEQRSSDHN